MRFFSPFGSGAVGLGLVINSDADIQGEEKNGAVSLPFPSHLARVQGRWSLHLIAWLPSCATGGLKSKALALAADVHVRQIILHYTADC